jgi:hypothetical protein
MSKKRKKKLAIDWEVPFEYEIFGICSHHPDYRAVWGVNNQMEWHLEKTDEPFVPNLGKHKVRSEHSFFEYHSEEERTDYFLIKNKGSKRLLIEEQPRIDYFLFVYDPSEPDRKELIKTLNKVEGILATYHFEEDALPSIKNIAL